MLPRALLFRTVEGTQGGRERSRDVRGCRGKAGESLGAEHVRAILKVPARVRLGRGAAFLIPRFQRFSFVLTSTQVVPDGFGVAYMTGCDGA